MKRRRLILCLIVLAAIAAVYLSRDGLDWVSLPDGGKFCVYRVTYESNAHVTFGGSPLHHIGGIVPGSLLPAWRLVAGPLPAEWWLPGSPFFTVWTVENPAAVKSGGGLGRVLLVLPDGQELPCQPGGFLLGTACRLRPFHVDSLHRALPRLHLRLFARDHPEPIDIDIPNPIHGSKQSSEKK